MSRIQEGYKIDIKAYLNSAYTIQQSIASAKETLSELEKCTQRSKSSYVLGKLYKAKNELNSLIERQTIEKLNIYAVINKVEDDVLRSLLNYKYICFLSFDSIAEKMHYSTRHIIRIHNKAINEAEKYYHSV